MALVSIVLQILIASAVYYTIVVIKRPAFWVLNFSSPLFKAQAVFSWKFKHNQQWYQSQLQELKCNNESSYSTYFYSIGTKIHALQRCGLVRIQISIARHMYVPLAWGVFFFCQGVFFLLVQFCKDLDFTLALIILHTNFKLQYLMNCSSSFNTFCRFWLLAVCTTLLQCLEG